MVTRSISTLILVIVDLFFYLLSHFFAKSFLGIDHISSKEEYVVLFSACFFLFISWQTGFYLISLRHVGIYALKKLSIVLICTFVISGIVIQLLQITVSVKVLLLSSLLIFLSILGYRVFLRELFFKKRQSTAIRCLVYGSGEAGIQFLTAALQGNSYNVKAIIDDDVNRIGVNIHGKEVFCRDRIAELLKLFNIDTVVLAIPSIIGSRRREIIEHILQFPVKIVSVPNINELNYSESEITKTQDIDIADLIGRSVVRPDFSLIDNFVIGCNILVTGAGGSIGSEIVRQLINFSPKRIILLDNNEPSLFAIEQEIFKKSSTDIICALGSVLDDQFLLNIFKENNIGIVFHAAAYKHVPMVESNPLTAFYNNVVGTMKLLDISLKYNVQSFTLVSTDKAVRPTNLMGASKRFAELYCQSCATKSESKISIVRFGNVIGSSGSVIPTFLAQIHTGGPITVTHPDVVRYFMTIPEAAQLVLQSSSMSNGGEVFLLDMGEPIKIHDIALKLIKLSGNRVSKDQNDKHGININFTGLRPGEKLYEELLVDSNAEQTKHSRIFKANENKLSLDEYNLLFSDALNLLDKGKTEHYRDLIKNSIISYNKENSDNNLLPSSLELQKSNTLPADDRFMISDQKNANSPKVFLGSKVLSCFLHLYFRLLRGLTIGVRCIIVSEQKEVLLIQHSYTDGWHLPGGGVEPNETIDTALSREVFEECQITIGTKSLIQTSLNDAISRRDHVFTYVCDEWTFEKEFSSSNEISNIKFFNLHNLPEDLEPAALESIELYKEQKKSRCTNTK